MNVLDIQTLFEFNYWANTRTLESVDSVSEEQLYEDLKNSFGGIHSTLVHICGAEDIWLQRLTNVSPTVFMKKEVYPTMEALKAKWSEVEEGYGTYLSALSEEDLLREYVITTQKGEMVSQKIWQTLQHLVNHSTYHRGQITTMLRQNGGTPIGTDLITFYRMQH